MSSLEKYSQAWQSVGETGTLKLDGVKLAWWRKGEGAQTLVLIHGNSACKEVFHNQFNQLDMPMIAFDLPGHGSSSDAAQPESQYTIPGYALLIKRALQAMEITNPLVYGWSLGGHIGIEMAGRGFDLAGLAISGTPPCGPGMEEVMQAFMPVEAGAITTAAEATDEQIDLYVRAVYGGLDPVPELFTRAARRTDGIARATMGMAIAMGEQGCHQRTVVAGWDKPMACGHGEQDEFINREYLDTVVWRNLDEGKIRTFRTGHAPFVEDPDAFNDWISGFASRVYG